MCSWGQGSDGRDFFFFNQIVIHGSFRQGNWNQQNALSQSKGWEKLDQVSKWKLDDQEKFSSQENYRLEPESESESEVAQSCPTLCKPMDCSPPASSIHGIFLARIL